MYFYLRLGYKMFRSPAISSVVQGQHYPHPEMRFNKKYPRIHRIVLNSRDYHDDTPNLTFENLTFKVNLPQDIMSENAMVYVESFHMTNSTANAVLETRPYNIHIRGMPQPLSYHSATKSTSDVVVSLKGRTYTGNLSHGFGVPLTDKRFFRNSTINVYFSSQDTSIVDAMDAHYILTLVIVEMDD